MQWKAENYGRQQKILRILLEGDCYFTELKEKLERGRKTGWGRQTVNLYLKELTGKGWVTQKKQGRKMMYSLTPSNPGVMAMLGLGRVIRKGQVQLSSLDEEEFIEEWIHTLKFTLLNIIKDYLAISENANNVENLTRYLEAHFSDLTEVTKYHGELMVNMMNKKTLNSAKMGTAVDNFQRELMERKKQ